MFGREMLCRHVATSLSTPRFDHDALSSLSASEASIAGVLRLFRVSVCVSVSVIHIFTGQCHNAICQHQKQRSLFIFIFQDRAS